MTGKPREVIRMAQTAGEHARPGGGATWYRVDGQDLEDQLRGVRGNRHGAAVLGAVAGPPAALTALLAAVTSATRLLINAKVLQERRSTAAIPKNHHLHRGRISFR